MLPCLVTIETPIIGELADVMSELQHPYHISNLQCMADCSSSSKLNSPLPACVKTNSNSSIARLNWVLVNSDWSLSSVNPWVIGGSVVWRADTWIIFFISIFVLRSNKYLVMWHLPERHLPGQACYENCEDTHTHTLSTDLLRLRTQQHPHTY